MSLPGGRGFRFVHPDFDSGAPGLGLCDLGLQMADGAVAVRQSILLLLSTSPGERVMRPDYGCDLRRLVFAPNDATTAGLAVHFVRQALERFEPRVEILNLDAEPHSQQPDRIDVILDYRVRATGRAERLVYGLSLHGENA